MGFDADAATAALLSCGGSVEEAINTLVEAADKEKDEDDLGLNVSDLNVSSSGKKKKKSKRRSTGKKKKTKKKSIDAQGADDLMSDLFAPVSATPTTTTSSEVDPFAMLAQSIENGGTTSTSSPRVPEQQQQQARQGFSPPQMKMAIDPDDPFANLF